MKTDVLCNSFLAGISQSVIGHPYDTIKTLKQMNNKKKNLDILKDVLKNNGVRYMYRGFIPPLIGGCLQNCILFSSEDISNKYIKNSFNSGFIAGSVTAVVISPFELIKSKLQVNKDTNIEKIISEKGFKYFKGVHLTVLRDSIGYGIYFASYKFLQEKYNNPLINGGIAGTLSWIYSYPIDVVKTKYKLSNNKSLLKILKKE